MVYFTAKTLEGVPDKPAVIRAKLEEDNIKVYWEEPVNPNGKIAKYNVYFKGRRVYNNSFKDDLLLVESKASRNTSIEEDKLKPGTKYTIHVTAFTERGEGAPSDTVIVSTLAKAPSAPPPPQVLHGRDVTSSTITIYLSSSPDNNGRVVAHEVVVEKIEIASSCLTSSLPDNILGYKEAMANGDRYYIAARFERDKEQVPRKFVVGDGEIYGDYLNAPLEPSCKTVYKAYVRAATEINGKWVYGEPAAVIPPLSTTDTDEVQQSSACLSCWKVAVLVEGVLLAFLAVTVGILVVEGRAKRIRKGR
ncbi:receptor-type tyrosine-protein phosphatase kappa-like [Porites lutea]|uniref:receptor-type tyrosine-protein phosphatase kappa-like n=1 Tax=Porites lutea TaxID=51062 RepID=UPI003CC635E5